MHDYKRFFREFEEFRIRARQLFEERVSAVYGGGQTSSGEWTPAVDIYETGDRIVLVAELPGVRIEDVSIQVLGNSLALRGTRPFEKPGLSPENYLRMESAYGTFERSFTLPAPVQEDCVEAVLRNGLLTVTLPRADGPRGRRIEIGPG